MNKAKACKIPCPIMNFLLKRVVDPSLPTDSSENRTRIGMLEGWVSAILSLFLCVVKGWLGLVSGSVSMLADATNNLTDMGSSLVVALGFQWSRKPSDEEHPFGHGRIEAVATLVLSIALLVVGFEVGKSGAVRLLNPKPVDAPMWILIATGITVIIKLWLAVFARVLARLSKSHVLEADSWNHIFDVVCTLLVIVALVGARMGYPALDGWTAIAVSIFIIITGIKFAREAIDILLGEKPNPEEVRAIRRVVESVDGVLGAHEIMVHQYGDVKMVSFHIEVDAKLTVIAAHIIAEIAEEAVEIQLQWRAVAHVDPVDRSHPFFGELHQILYEYVESDSQLIDFHDLRADGKTSPYAISFDLVTVMGIPRSRYSEIYENILTMIGHRFEDRVATAEIGIEAAIESAPMERKQFNIVRESGK
jgi:cation diffusion facilitator family transporter